MRVLRETVRGVLNLEMAATDEMLRIAREVKPDFCTLVPEKREERTTEGGLSVGPGGQVEKVVRALADAGIGVSLFIDPEPRVVEASARLGVGTVELHTGDYCLAPARGPEAAKQLQRLELAARAAADAGLRLGAGHGLDYTNLGPVVALPGLEELQHRPRPRRPGGIDGDARRRRGAARRDRRRRRGLSVDFPLVLTAAEMRAADAAVARVLGVPTLRLMETAGRGVAAIVRRELGDMAGGVTIVCGGGSNGGDGFVAARQLALAGLSVRVLLTAPKTKLQGDAAAAWGLLAELGSVTVEDGSGWTDEATWGAQLAGRDASVDAVVDAIFGTGFRGPVRDVAAAAIAAMNAADARKIAVDIPSGLDSDSGRASGVVFRADVTATMGARKLGLCVDASAPVGRIRDRRPRGAGRRDHRAGLPMPPARRARDSRARAAPERRREQGEAGHLLVVAGSTGKTGAAFLVGTAALRAGAGLVTVASTAAGQIALDAKAIELMTARYTDSDEVVPAAAAGALRALAARAQAVALGPGIPTGAEMRAVVHELAAQLPLPMVLDADALNALGTDAPRILASAPAPRVLTPHPGEMGRLLGISIAEVQADRLAHARGLAASTRAIVVLKGARTIVAAPDGQAFINPTACSALATAGSGDVLCGVIGALLARRVDPLCAAQVGVFVHGAAGEQLAPRLGDGVVAGNLPLAIAGVMARLAG